MSNRACDRAAYDRTIRNLARHVGHIYLAAAGGATAMLRWDDVGHKWYREVRGGAAMHLREPTLHMELARLEREGYAVRGAAQPHLALRPETRDSSLTAPTERTWRGRRSFAAGERSRTGRPSTRKSGPSRT